MPAGALPRHSRKRLFWLLRRIAKAQQEEALLAFEQKLLDAGTEVNEALVSYQISKRKKDNYENQVAALEKAFTSTSLLMQHGNTTYLEVLTARQTLLNAQLSQTANCFKEIQSLINLYQEALSTCIRRWVEDSIFSSLFLVSIVFAGECYLTVFPLFSLSYLYSFLYSYPERKTVKDIRSCFYWVSFLFKQNLAEEFRTMETRFRQVYLVP